jgi:transcriptional regulator with XRE-family HTH domain
MGVVVVSQASASAQVGLYGATWASRFGALRAAYGLSQGALAATVGLSAPMVSQLVSGQRVKISNPAVLARIVRMEECLSDPAVAAGDERAIAAVLDSIASTTPVLRTTTVGVQQDREAAIGWLAMNGSASDLSALADVARSRGADAVAAVLGAAARGSH